MTQRSGKRQPPTGRRFRKGVSGNPKGRPKRQASQLDSSFDVLFDKAISMTEGGRVRKVTMEDALFRKTYEAALQGDRAACRQVLKAIQERDDWLARDAAKRVPDCIARQTFDPTNADAAMRLLGLVEHGAVEDRSGYREERLLMAPWAVQAALDRRRGASKLTTDDLDQIKRRTAGPGAIRWPEADDG